jgi:glycosyltransferase involved in cell wall biosynthesis
VNLVSIILPTYNRKKFLTGAFKSIESQQYKNWELIIVDDGSSDGSIELLTELKRSVTNPVRIIQQENAGPAVARNTGILEANGDFIAFFDSDDYWLPDHLSLSISTFTEFPDLEWLYFACKRVDLETGNTILESTFKTHGEKNALFGISQLIKPDLYKLDNTKATLTQIKDGIDSGFQNSVFRQHVFNQLLIPDFRIGEDRLFILKALKKGIQTAFIDKVTVVYQVHDDNSSDTKADSKDYGKRIESMQRLIDSYEATFTEINLTNVEKKELKKRLSEDYFWKLGYSLQLASNRSLAAMCSMWKGICLYPYKIKYWKTFSVTFLRGCKSPLHRKLLKKQIIKKITGKKNILVIGDSHAEVFFEKKISSEFKKYQFTVVSVGGATISGLANPNSATQAMPIFRQHYYNLKPDIIITLLGEVDTGFVMWHKATRKNKLIAEVLQESIRHYSDLLKEFTVPEQAIVISAPLPTIKDGQDWGEIANARKDIDATQKERTDLTIQFNQLMSLLCEEKGLLNVNLDSECLSNKGLVRDELLNINKNDHHYDMDKYAGLIAKHIKKLFD